MNQKGLMKLVGLKEEIHPDLLELLEHEERKMERVKCGLWVVAAVILGVIVYLAYLGVMSLTTPTQ